MWNLGTITDINNRAAKLKSKGLPESAAMASIGIRVLGNTSKLSVELNDDEDDGSAKPDEATILSVRIDIRVLPGADVSLSGVSVKSKS